MPLGNALVDPRLFDRLRRTHWVSVCAIYDTTDTQSSITGEVGRVKNASPVSGLERIACNLSQVLGRGADVSEIRNTQSTYVSQQYECQLDAYYASIEEDMVAVVDGVEFDIRGVKQSSVRSHTVLILERVR